jgi:transporter family protein
LKPIIDPMFASCLGLRLPDYGRWITAAGLQRMLRARWQRPCVSFCHLRQPTTARRMIPTETPAWFAWALLSACFAALTAILAKVGLDGIDPDYATLVRTLVIVAVLAAIVAAGAKWSNPLALRPKSLLFLALSGLATGASWVCYFRALKLGDASRVAPIDKLSVVLVALFATIFLGERPGARDWLGIGLICLGALLLGLRR